MKTELGIYKREVIATLWYVFMPCELLEYRMEWLETNLNDWLQIHYEVGVHNI